MASGRPSGEDSAFDSIRSSGVGYFEFIPPFEQSTRLFELTYPIYAHMHRCMVQGLALGLQFQLSCKRHRLTQLPQA